MTHPTNPTPAAQRDAEVAVAAPSPGLPPESLDGPALAQAVAVEVMGLTVEHRAIPKSSTRYVVVMVNGKQRNLPDYPGESAAAMQVARRLHELHYAVRIEMSRFETFPLVRVWRLDTHPLGPGWPVSSAIPTTEPDRLPEAICRVALQAVRLEAAAGGGA